MTSGRPSAPGGRPGVGQLAGMVAVVTGGGQGIGAAVCHRFETDGARVAILDIDGAQARTVAADLPRVEAWQVDVTDPAELAGTVAAVLRRWGRVDVVVPCAGVMRPAPVASLSESDWAAVVDSHLTGSFAVVRAALPSMMDRRSGRVVLVSSVAARGLAGNVAYSTAKAGVVGMTRALAMELGPYGVHTNAVAPGFIDTAMTRDGARRRGQEWSSFAAGAAQVSALRRIGTPAEVARVVGFLAGPDASYVNGQVIHVSGSP